MLPLRRRRELKSYKCSQKTPYLCSQFLGVLSRLTGGWLRKYPQNLIRVMPAQGR